MGKPHLLLRRILLLRLGSRRPRPTTVLRRPASVRPRQPLARHLPAIVPPVLRLVVVVIYPQLLPLLPSTHLLPLAGLPRAPSLIRLPLLILLALRRRPLLQVTARLLRLTAQRKFIESYVQASRLI